MFDTPDQNGTLLAPDGAPANPTPPVKPRFSLIDFFLGDDGLRAGWSLLVYVALLVLLLYASGSIVDRVQQRASHSDALITPSWVLVSEGASFLSVLAATWIMAKIERRPATAFGFGRWRWLSNFLAGLGWGVTFLSLLVLGLHSTGLLVFDGRLLVGREAVRYGAAWFVGFLLVGLLEEYLFRGYLQLTLARGLSGVYEWLRIPHGQSLGFWTAAVLLSFGFGFTHRSNAGESPIGLLAAGLIGVVFCLSLWRTGSLWWAIGFHASWDWAQSFLYGVADSGTMVQGHLFATHPVGRPIFSGGLTGPEGSALILPIIGSITAVILLTLPRTGFRYAAQEKRADVQEPHLHLDLD